MKQYSSLGQLFLERVTKRPEKESIGRVDGDVVRFYSNKEYALTTERITAGLIGLGIRPGHKVALLSQTRLEWHLCDIGILNAGGVVVPIYPNYTIEEIDWVLQHSETEILVCEDEIQLSKLKNSQIASKLKKIIVIESEETDLDSYNNLNTLTFAEVKDLGKEYLKDNLTCVRDTINTICREDVATIIYTSGTTGEPKGAMIDHGAILQMLQNLYESLNPQIGPEDRTLTFLPLSHVLGRSDSYLHLVFGLECVYAQSIERLLDNLKVACPTVMIAVPRIFEKIYERINHKVSNEGHIKRAAFEWAMAVSKKYFDKIDKDLAPEASEIIQRNLSYKLVFKKIYDQFGGRIRFFVSGGAPLNQTIVSFLRNANLTILEGYGLTETVAPCTLNPIAKQVAGSVGLPLGDVQIKFSEDDEILIRSRALFKGYYKNEKASQEAITKDGFFYSGDIGELTADGYLKITDRKKDIIITSGGKNVAPQKIESLAKLSPFISQIVIIGDKRKYLTALVEIEKDAFSEQLEDFGLSRQALYQEIASHPKTVNILKSEIEKVNEKLSRFEQIKQFKILDKELSIESGHLTPSLKVKKKKVMNDFISLINSMY
jgi:long-chain acyl-CoA synthetase